MFQELRQSPAMAAGASVLIYAASWLLPLAGVLVSPWSPLPLILLYRRQGASQGRRAVIMAGAGALFVFYFFAPYGGLLYLYYGLMALVLGELHEFGIGDDAAVGAAGCVSALSILLIAFSLGLFSGEGTSQLWGRYWDEGWEQFLAAFPELSQDTAQIQKLRALMGQIVRVMLKLGPGLLLAGSLFLAWANLLLARWLRRREEDIAPLNTWQAPEPLVWVLIPAGGLVALGDGFWFWFGANLFLVLSVVYFFQGCAIVAYWLERKNAPPFLKAAVLVLVLAEIYVVLAIALAGLFDMWFNFRRLERKTAA